MVNLVSFITAYHTEKGYMKQENQDALMIKIAQTNQGTVGLFVVCDGMGGLGNGEIASSMAITSLSNWFGNDLPNLLPVYSFDEIPQYLVNRIEQINEQIIDYGAAHHVKCGTTLTAIFIIGQQFYTFQIGDSRAYLVGHEVTQLTKDQSLIARELERGTITPEQVPSHPDRHVILQCLGIQPTIEVVTKKGMLSEDEYLLLCTDGFYHRITYQEISTIFQPSFSNRKESMNEYLKFFTQSVQHRGEKDDITALLITLN